MIHGNSPPLEGYLLTDNQHILILNSPKKTEEMTMWTKPQYTEMRLGFEVTLYISNR
ncbi:coenzyme PQQ precursor peptide PqqA [Alteromonas sp. 76-1]|jgi:pyrroloquinoline quinone biosynthesis protein A|nr:pyrroloquinoline quinone precursor peptide PqqA [Rickettsiales bacterium]PHS56149.1 MAG: pyrroloquinoline quinone precursor peptide PqqA [Alteromonas sp.]CAD5260660.1 Coenzyme PQQ synthesis protein A [Alteromonas sp. 154]VEL98378.1 coenzyme PQQ precursor peptide PqqA [Alteromonas sp. 76-1]VXC31354.1 Coenzyme PQQ synthesis protein A [Alteromonas sp. 38]